MSRKRSDDCTPRYIYVQILPPSLVFRASRYYKRGIRFFGVILERLSLLKSWTLPTNIKNMKLFFIFSFSLMLVVTKSKPIEKPRVILKSGNYAIIDSFKIVSNIYLILVSKRKSFKNLIYLYENIFKKISRKLSKDRLLSCVESTFCHTFSETLSKE